MTQKTRKQSKREKHTRVGWIHRLPRAGRLRRSANYLKARWEMEKPHLDPGVPRLRFPASGARKGSNSPLPLQFRSGTPSKEAALGGKMARKRVVAPLRLFSALPPNPRDPGRPRAGSAPAQAAMAAAAGAAAAAAAEVRKGRERRVHARARAGKRAPVCLPGLQRGRGPERDFTLIQEGPAPGADEGTGVGGGGVGTEARVQSPAAPEWAAGARAPGARARGTRGRPPGYWGQQALEGLVPGVPRPGGQRGSGACSREEGAGPGGRRGPAPSPPLTSRPLRCGVCREGEGPMRARGRVVRPLQGGRGRGRGSPWEEVGPGAYSLYQGPGVLGPQLPTG